ADDLLEANRIMLELLERNVKGKIDPTCRIDGKVVIEEGAKISGSVIRGPVIIGANAEIVNSYIGPFTSIGPGAKVTNSEVEHSILLDECEMTDLNCRLTDSLIGKQARIMRTKGLPHVNRFILGDQSEAELL
ncbi:MAG TPA: glucose-1-phosphate thymidylyltransferase, partial [bacterium]|nr:glucose-1-phosphate thymidylyltransferase [bacterium]